ncbi:ABC transporter substrate-binding protein [Dactylosporangium sp. NPDC051484]|uniref:ABC transporter substrate-binding protein n=1 Tax=Dactylosporangium sp. NPDC051484 TaxID=3154942 RepID=UPI00344DE5E0
MALATVLTLAACGGGSGSNSSRDNTLRIGFALNQRATLNLDPRLSSSTGEIYVLSALYSPLMRYVASSHSYTPYLATKVAEVDNKTIAVELRPGLKFSDGSDLTAEDAKATFESMAKNMVAGKAGGLNPGIAQLDNVEVTSPTSFVMHFKSPAVGFIYDMLSGRESYIVPSQATADQNTKPVGSGAFKLKSFVPGSKIEMVKADTFFDAANVKLDGLTFISVDEGNAMLNALRAHTVDIGAGSAFGGLDPSSFKTLSGDSRFGTLTYPSENFAYFDSCKAPGYAMNNLKLRQALVYGTDRPALAEAIYGSKDLRAIQIWRPGSPYYDQSIDDDFAYNPEKAKQLLAEGGVKEGQKLKLILTPIDPAGQPLSLVLKDQWAKIGIDLEVSVGDIVTDHYVPASEHKTKYDASLSVLSREPSQRLSINFTLNTIRNICNYNDPKILAMIDKLQAISPNDPAAPAAWAEASRYLAETGALLPLSGRPTLAGWDKKRVDGVSEETLGRLAVDSIQYEKLSIKN